MNQNLCFRNDFPADQGSDGEKKRERRTEKSPPPSRNPFFNFLRDFRKSNTGIGSTQLSKIGAEIWRKMKEDQKQLYFELAKSAPTRRKIQEEDDEESDATELCNDRRGRKLKRGKSRKRSSRSRSKRRGKGRRSRSRSKRRGKGRRSRSANDYTD